MPSYYSGILLIVATTSSLFAKGSCLACNDPFDSSSGTCAQLSKDLDPERALVQDEGNLFRLRSIFRQSPTAAPILLKVLYNVTFADDIIFLVLQNFH
jgi:predicted amidophosphoribosyltransferase